MAPRGGCDAKGMFDEAGGSCLIKQSVSSVRRGGGVPRRRKRGVEDAWLPEQPPQGWGLVASSSDEEAGTEEDKRPMGAVPIGAVVQPHPTGAVTFGRSPPSLLSSLTGVSTAVPTRGTSITGRTGSFVEYKITLECA